MICEIRRSLLAALRIAVASVLIVVLAAPLGRAEDSEEGAGSDSEPLSDGGHEDHDDATSCDDLYALGEWTETQYGKLLDCLFDLPESSVTSSRPGSSKARSTDGGVARQASSECGDVNIEYIVQQYIPLHYTSGFLLGHFMLYLMELTCEDGSPAAGYRTGVQEIAGPNSGQYSEYCLVRRGRRIVPERTSSANGCPSFLGLGDPNRAFGNHFHRISHANDRRFRQVLFWADLREWPL